MKTYRDIAHTAGQEWTVIQMAEYIDRKEAIKYAKAFDELKDYVSKLDMDEVKEELQNKLEELNGYKEAGNMDDYAILAHALKTEARYVGCTVLGDMAYEHELAGKENNQALVNEKFDELKNEANRIYEVVKRYLGE